MDTLNNLINYDNKLFAVYKPKGISSTKYINLIKKHLCIQLNKKIKIGHGGTLDPNASGVLIIGTGNCTKLLSTHLSSHKTYIATIKFGYTSDTFDITGNVIEKENVNNVSIDVIKNNINKFIGIIKQKPPIYSALRINGKKAYELARDGVSFEMKERTIEVYSIEILSYDYPYLKIQINCGGGTYIRSIAHDIGVEIGTGALLYDLERIEANNFGINDCVDILNEK